MREQSRLIVHTPLETTPFWRCFNLYTGF